MSETENKKMNRAELDRMLDDMITSIANATSIGMSRVDIKQKIYHIYAPTIYGAMGIQEQAEMQIPVIHDTNRNGGIENETGWPLSFIAHADFGTLSMDVQDTTMCLKSCITHFDILDDAKNDSFSAIEHALGSGLPSFAVTVMRKDVYDAVTMQLYEENHREFLCGQLWIISNESFIDDSRRDAYLHCYLVNVTDSNALQIIPGVICFHGAFDDHRPTYNEIEVLLSTRFVQNRRQAIYTDVNDTVCIQYMSNYYYEWEHYLWDMIALKGVPLMDRVIRFAAGPNNSLAGAYDYYSYGERKALDCPKKPIVFVSPDVLNDLDDIMTYCVPHPSIGTIDPDGGLSVHDIPQLIKALDNMLIVTIDTDMLPHSDIKASTILVRARHYQYKVCKSGRDKVAQIANPGDIVVLGSFTVRNVVLSIDRTVVLDTIRRGGGNFAANGEDLMNLINAFYIGWNAKCTRLKPIVYTSFHDFIHDLTW